MGEVAAALDVGEVAIAHADRSGDAFRRLYERTTLADARHQAGALAEAHQLFEEAEGVWAKDRPDYPQLPSFAGYRYCDLLLTLGHADAVGERAAYELDRARNVGFGLLEFALNHLSLGRAALALGNRDEARRELDQAVDGLRQSATIHHLPRGLLARTAFFSDVEQYALSRRDMDEVMRLATRCGMRLHECDAHLEYARLEIKQGQPDAARVHVTSADALVTACGYHRRDGALAELKEELGL